MSCCDRKESDTLLRVYESGERALVQLPDDVTRMRAGFWGSILAMVAEAVAREYAVRGEGGEREILAQIQNVFGAELAAYRSPKLVIH